MSSKDGKCTPNARLIKKLGPVETSILEYVLSAHGSKVNRRAGLISIFMHAQLLSRGARLSNDSVPCSSLIQQSYLDSDPIRLSYTLVCRPKSETLATESSQLQLSVAESDCQLFVSLTDTATDKFGHLEVSGVEHVRIDCPAECDSGDFLAIFPQINELLQLAEEKLWNPVLPSPPHQRVTDMESKSERKSERIPEPNMGHPRPDYGIAYQPPLHNPLSDYGRSDLDPFGAVPGHGGMLMDPRRPPQVVPPSLGGPDLLPPGAVPPGARFDPFGPGVVPIRPGLGRNRPRLPDPDHAMPPGYDDMYM